MKKLSPNQAQLVQALQANPQESIQTYYPVSRGHSNSKRCYLTKRHINFRWATVESLHRLGYLEVHPATKYPKEESYTLSEKGKSWQL